LQKPSVKIFIICWFLISIGSLIGSLTETQQFMQPSYNKSVLEVLTTHGPIFIDGNTALDTFPNKTGTGTAADPYVIEKLEIDAGNNNSGIEIRNTDRYLIIENSVILNSGTNILNQDAGIKLENCTNIKIINCTLRNNFYGIYMKDSSYNAILGTQPIYNNTRTGIVLDHSDHNLISGIIVHSNEFGGINIRYSKNTTISSITLYNYTNYHWGIDVFRSNFTNIIGNTIFSVIYYGIEVEVESYNTTILGNTIYDCQYGLFLRTGAYYTNVSGNAFMTNQEGIFVFYSDDNFLLGNNFSQHGRHAIRIEESARITVTGNIMSKDGLVLRGTGIPELASHTISTTNTVNGKPLYYYINTVGLTQTEFLNAGQIILVNCNNSAIVGYDLSDGSEGIALFYSHHNVIQQVNVSNSKYEQGIYLYYSDFNSFSKVEASFNYKYGAHLSHSHFNNFTDSEFSYNLVHGVYLYSSDHARLTSNQVLNNSQKGIYDYVSHYSTVTYNTILKNNEHGLHLKVSENCTLAYNDIQLNQLYGIYLEQSAFNQIQDNTVWNNLYHGIYLKDSPYTVLLNNQDSYNGGSGIFVTTSDNIYVLGNTISFNVQFGLALDSTSKFGTISNNQITSNHEEGIMCNGSYHLFYLNTIGYNANCNLSRQISDNGVENQWYSNTIKPCPGGQEPTDGGGIPSFEWFLCFTLLLALSIPKLLKIRPPIEKPK